MCLAPTRAHPPHPTTPCHYMSSGPPPQASAHRAVVWGRVVMRHVVARGGWVDVGGPCGQYISLKDHLSEIRSERIKQVDKVKKLISRIKGLGWRHIPLLGFVHLLDPLAPDLREVVLK